MNELLDRFLRYVRVHTTSDETSSTSPSTARQLDLCRMLEEECRQMGLVEVECSPHGVVTALLPPTVAHSAPGIAWLAHVDTSPEYSGENVNPVVHEKYDGGDITLPGDPSKIIRVADNPALNDLRGGTIITSDGTTLLGADDKSGVAVIMSAAAELMAHPEIPRGPIRLCFTCDEEIGRGTDHIDIPRLAAVCGYTLDGEGQGRIDGETFSADLATITVAGVNTHPSEGKGVMVNAIRILAAFIARLPTDHLSPETTSDREGFLHPYNLQGGVAEAGARIILRDFEAERLTEYADLLRSLAEQVAGEFPGSTIDVAIRQQYRNLRDGLGKEPRAIPKAIEALRAAGLEPQETIIRGGTDGSVLTARGLPCPNLSTGEHNPHSPLEWTSLEEMQTAVRVLVELARGWSSERL